jgi:hypothetical protein
MLTKAWIARLSRQAAFPKWTLGSEALLDAPANLFIAQYSNLLATAAQWLPNVLLICLAKSTELREMIALSFCLCRDLKDWPEAKACIAAQPEIAGL